MIIFFSRLLADTLFTRATNKKILLLHAGCPVFSKNLLFQPKEIWEAERLRIYLQPIGFTNKKGNNMRRDIFQAIADPTRRAIIALIALQSMTPNAIAENFDITRQSVSRHLRILTECELVKQEQQGREIYYTLEIQKMKEVDKWMGQFRKIWETRYAQLDNVLATIKKQKK